MSRTITGTSSVGIKLTHPGDNPLTVATGASIVTARSYALYGSGTTHWMITNDGVLTAGTIGILLAASGTVVNDGSIGAYNGSHFKGSGVGVSLALGGLVVNGAVGDSSASITGGYSGVRISGQSGTVKNSGSMFASVVYVYSGSGMTARSTLGCGVTMSNGGAVTNGTIGAPAASIAGGKYGVVISGQAGMVQNVGRIVGLGFSSNSFQGQGSHGFFGMGVKLTRGGSVTNGAAFAPGARIKGGRFGVYISGAAGSVSNLGVITGFQSTGVLMLAGGSLTNGASGSTSATISGSAFGVKIAEEAGTVTNAGTISGAIGVQFGSNVTRAVLINTGTIDGTSGIAVQFQSGNDRLSISAGAVFAGKVVATKTGANVVDLQRSSAAGTLSGIGRSFVSFGALSVQASAQWSLAGTNTSGGTFGIDLAAGSDLTVTGSLAIGARLRMHGAGRLDVGSTGKVEVGQAGLGAIGTITVDAATTSAAAGVIKGSGTLASPITDNGSIQASGGTLTLDGNVGGAGVVAITANAVLQVTGALDSARLTFLAGGSETLELGQAASVGAVIKGFAATDTIDLLGRIAAGLSFSAATHVLTVTGASGTLAALHFSGRYVTSSFAFVSDAHGGTNITLT